MLVQAITKTFKVHGIPLAANGSEDGDIYSQEVREVMPEAVLEIARITSELQVTLFQTLDDDDNEKPIRYKQIRSSKLLL